ncbi:hypothetical protein GJ496_005550 [Pomphorhynchus laevis]|nr:hypothetical protein GJ496_005550 [Pomphorhynchus laevis]
MGDHKKERNGGSTISKELESLINKQIVKEFEAAHQYNQMATYFSGQDVALMNFSKYFLKEAKGEYQHAWQFINFLQSRGGKIRFENIAILHDQHWNSVMELMQFHFQMEESVFEHIKHIRKVASDEGDFNLENFLEQFYDHQHREQFDISSHITNLKRLESSDGLDSQKELPR